ncbi:MAG: arginine--tRNA ligase, partial [Gemmatimonadaceae bacterium]
MSNQEDELRAEITRAARAVGAPEDFEAIVERPRDPAFGDWATNAAMVLGKQLRRKPREIAEALIEKLDFAAAGLSAAEIAGPGFINFRVATDTIAKGLTALVGADVRFGLSTRGANRPVNVEFVSANPTGPLHVGHGRQAAIGDAIASLLQHTGWVVTREFYYNDGGAQIDNLALSVQARVRQLDGRDAEIPEGGYHGEYIKDIAQRYVETYPSDQFAEDLDVVRQFAVKELRK